MSNQQSFKNNPLVQLLWAILAALLATLTTLLLTQSPLSVYAATNVSGSITGDTTWNVAGSPYVITDTVWVLSGATLTIDPGVTVKFESGTSLWVSGALIADDCRFTSNASTPVPGDWGQILFLSSSVDAVVDTFGNNYVSGSKIRNCFIEYGGGGNGVNGAIETSTASPFLALNIIRNNGAAGIYAIGRSTSQPVIISRNTVSNNVTDSEGDPDGGGITVTRGQVITNTIRSNTATNSNGGGVFASTSVILDNSVEDNVAGLDGGGIYATNSTLSGNFVSSNTANNRRGGGIYAKNSVLSGNTISSNTSNYQTFFGSIASGGGIYAEGSTISDNTISGNTVSSFGGSGLSRQNASGGGIYASGSTISDNMILNNNAITTQADDNSHGGGVYAEGGTVISNTVSGNTATGGANGFGGGIYADGATLTNNTVSSNSATGGSDSLGGGVYSRLNTIEQNMLSDNSANKGGAIYIDQGTANSNTVDNNDAANDGGGIYATNATATDNTVSNNTADKGGGLYSTGGAQITNNQVEDNEANFGGGIYALSETTLDGNTVMSNTAQNSGGGLYVTGGAANSNIVAYNAVPFGGQGSGAYLLGAVNFSSNSVMTNSAPSGTAGGVTITGTAELHFNNLHGNQPFEAEVISSDPVSGTLNYWGPIPCTDIGGRIYDGNDLPGRGELHHAPSLASPSAPAQLLAPRNLTLITTTNGLTLTWAAIPAIPDVGCRPPGWSGPDLGYRLYYDTVSICTAAGGHSLPVGDSPVDLGEATSLTLPPLAAEYHFAVAAYDYLDRQSHFSNEVIYPPPDNYIQVSYPDREAAVGAELYHNGLLLGTTDGLGRTVAERLQANDTLIALHPVSETATTRAAHDGWAYRTYATNIAVDGAGDTQAFTVINASGVQSLTVRTGQTLVSFNIVVSIEWDATESYIQSIALAMEQAAHLLYDATDGQMTFGQVAIYDNAAYWSAADLQISAKNTIRPYAYVRGITGSDPSHLIRVGRFWDGLTADAGDWSQEEGFRTLVHEFGHYGLGLFDEYFGYDLLGGDLAGQHPAFCTGPENRTNPDLAAGGSVMDYHYTTSELVDAGRWTSWCQQSVQHQLNNGESDWETLTRLFNDPSGQARWGLVSPDERAGTGNAVPGPATIPGGLPFPVITTQNSGASPDPFVLDVCRGSTPYPDGAWVALYLKNGLNNGKVMDQGATNSSGELDILGGQAGDLLRVISQDGTLAGAASVPLSGCLSLNSLGQAAAKTAQSDPYLQLRPAISNGSLIGVTAIVTGVSSGETLTYTPTGPEEVGTPVPLTYIPTSGDHRGVSTFVPSALFGYGWVQNLAQTLDILVDYRLQQAPNAAEADLFSNDGNLRLHLDSGAFPAAEAYFLIASPWGLPAPIPDGQQIASEAYEITAATLADGNDLTQLSKPAVLRLHYDPATNPNLAELAIYRWDAGAGAWQSLGGEINEEQQEVVTATADLGLYVLLGKPVSRNIYLPLVLR